jgi:hypothetical protein
MLYIKFVINPISLAPFWKILPLAWLLQLLCFTVFLASILTSTCSGAIPELLLRNEQEKSMEVRKWK